MSYSQDSTGVSKKTNDRYIITRIQLQKIVEKDIKFDSLQKRFDQLLRLQKEVIEPAQIMTKQADILANKEIENLQKIVQIDKRIIKDQGFKNVWLKIRLPLSFVTAFYLGNVLAQNGIIIKF